MPEEQTVFFQRGHEQEALQQTQTLQTTLTQWFALNAKDDHARKLRYQDIPEYYTWQTKTKIWQRRKQEAGTDKVLGRIHAANPADQERFYLYLVLLQARGLLNI